MTTTLTATERSMSAALEAVADGMIASMRDRDDASLAAALIPATPAMTEIVALILAARAAEFDGGPADANLPRRARLAALDMIEARRDNRPPHPLSFEQSRTEMRATITALTDLVVELLPADHEHAASDFLAEERRFAEAFAGVSSNV